MPEEAVQETTETTVEAPTMDSVGVFPQNAPEETPPAEEPKPAENTEPKPEENAVEDPAEKKEDVPDLFAENSKTAFINENGEFNSEKLTSFLEESNGFYDNLVFDPIKPLPEIEAENDPEVMYKDSIMDIATNFKDKIQIERDAGYSDSEIVEHLEAYYDHQAATRDNLINENKRLDRKMDSKLAKVNAVAEFAANKEIAARIETVTNRLSPRFEGLIEGSTGEETLDKFALGEKYGGKFLQVMFNRENKDHGKLSPEEKKEAVSKWQKVVQTDGRVMAELARIGEAIWQVEQLPNTIQNAIRIGAGKTNMQRNATFNSKVKPNNGTKQTANMHPQLAGFFGRSVE